MAYPDPLPPGWTYTRTGLAVSPQQRQYLEAGLNRGLSVNAALAAMRAGGIGITERVGYDLAVDLRGQQLSASRLSRAPANFVPAHADYAQVDGMGRAQYRVTGKFSYTRAGETEPMVGYAHAFSDSLLPLDTLRARLEANVLLRVAGEKKPYEETGQEIDVGNIDFYAFQSFTRYPGIED